MQQPNFFLDTVEETPTQQKNFFLDTEDDTTPPKKDHSDKTPKGIIRLKSKKKRDAAIQSILANYNDIMNDIDAPSIEELKITIKLP